MKLNCFEFGKLLEIKLQQTKDIVVLSRWAYQLYLDNSRDLDPELRQILLDITRMEDAPEFEFSIEELKQLAQTLQKRCKGVSP